MSPEQEAYNPTNEQERFIPYTEQYSYSEQVEELAFKASEMEEFQDIVNNAKGKGGAIRDIRVALPQELPEVADIPAPRSKDKDSPVSPPSNDFIVARNIYDLLTEAEKK